MAQFRDNAGRVWQVKIDSDAVSRVRSKLKIDLLDVPRGRTFKRLLNPLAVCDVLYAVCKPLADKLGIDDRTFGESLGGAIDEASIALFKSLIEFLPGRSGRALASRLARL